MVGLIRTIGLIRTTFWRFPSSELAQHPCMYSCAEPNKVQPFDKFWDRLTFDPSIESSNRDKKDSFVCPIREITLRETFLETFKRLNFVRFSAAVHMETYGWISTQIRRKLWTLLWEIFEPDPGRSRYSNQLINGKSSGFLIERVENSRLWKINIKSVL